MNAVELYLRGKSVFILFSPIFILDPTYVIQSNFLSKDQELTVNQNIEEKSNNKILEKLGFHIILRKCKMRYEYFDTNMEYS